MTATVPPAEYFGPSLPLFTPRRPRLLDLFSCAGGAGMGYYLAGFEVVGVDIEPQPRYPFEFHQGDALEYLAAHGHEFDAIHASPPCQDYSKTQRINKVEWPRLIAPVRELMIQLGKPYVIENVMDALPELINPIMLCGAMFPGLGTYRHRLFESSFTINPPPHPPHTWRTTKMGRKPIDGEFMHVVGNFSGAGKARVAMGMSWATRDELREAIPPAYTEFIGRQLIQQLEVRAA